MPVLVEDRRNRQAEFDWMVGTNLRMVREKREMTQYTLADLIDSSQPHIRRVEAGDRALTLQQAIASAKALGVPLRRLTQEIE